MQCLNDEKTQLHQHKVPIIKVAISCWSMHPIYTRHQKLVHDKKKNSLILVFASHCIVLNFFRLFSRVSVQLLFLLKREKKRDRLPMFREQVIFFYRTIRLLLIAKQCFFMDNYAYLPEENEKVENHPEDSVKFHQLPIFFSFLDFLEEVKCVYERTLIVACYVVFLRVSGRCNRLFKTLEA